MLRFLYDGDSCGKRNFLQVMLALHDTLPRIDFLYIISRRFARDKALDLPSRDSLVITHVSK